MSSLLADSLPPECLAKYRVERLLGSGGFGHAFEATQLSLGRRVVLKVPGLEALADREQLDRFRNEALVTSRLRHANVVVLLDFGTADGRPWIVYELVNGPDLRTLISRETGSLGRAVECCHQVACGLEAAHALGVLHRDIKPENILRSSSGVCKVADFGLAKWSEGGRLRTQAGVLLGTPAYMAPEVISGEPATAASDLYALGVLFFELLAGRRPFEDASPAELFQRHLHEPPPPPSSLGLAVPAALDRLALRLLAKEPSSRPPSAAEVRSELEEWLHRLDRPAGPTLHGVAAASSRGTERKTLVNVAAPSSTLPGAAPASRTGRDEPIRPPVLAARPDRRRAWLFAVMATAVGISMAVTGWKYWTIPAAPDGGGPRDPAGRRSASSIADVPRAEAPTRPRPARSIDDLREIVRREPLNWPAWLELAEAYEGVSRDRARDKFVHVLKNAGPLAPGLRKRLHAGLGRVAAGAGDFRKAVDELELAVALDPADLETVRALAWACRAIPASHARAIETLLGVIERGPPEPADRRQIGLWLEEDGRDAEAEPYLEAARRESESDPQVSRALAYLRSRQGKAVEVIALLEPIAEELNDPDVWIEIGQSYRRLGSSSEAEGPYRRALAIRPGGRAEGFLGQTLAELGKIERAEPMLRAALSRSPGDSASRLSLSGLLERTGRREEALAGFRQGLGHDPADVWLCLETSRLLTEDGELDEAETLARRVLDREPDQLVGLYRLAEILARQGRLAEALEVNRKIVPLAPEDARQRVLVAEQEARLRAGASPDSSGRSPGR